MQQGPRVGRTASTASHKSSIKMGGLRGHWALPYSSRSGQSQTLGPSLTAPAGQGRGRAPGRRQLLILDKLAAGILTGKLDLLQLEAKVPAFTTVSDENSALITMKTEVKKTGLVVRTGSRDTKGQRQKPMQARTKDVKEGMKKSERGCA